MALRLVRLLLVTALATTAMVLGAGAAAASDPMHDEELQQEFLEAELDLSNGILASVEVPVSTASDLQAQQVCTLQVRAEASYHKPAFSLDQTETGSTITNSPDCGSEFWSSLTAYVRITHSGFLAQPFETEDSAQGPAPGPIVATTAQTVPTYVFPAGYYGPLTVVEWFFRGSGFIVDGREAEICVELTHVVFVTSQEDFVMTQVPCP